MSEDTDVLLELTDGDLSDADAAAEDTARMLMEVRERRGSPLAESDHQTAGSESTGGDIANK